MTTIPTIISFYTNDWIYPRHAERLRRECDRLKINHYIKELPSAGGYLQNTCLKPKFILDALQNLKRSVLWIDVDASILKPPNFFVNFEYDIGAKRMPETRDRTWHVGTLFFQYNSRTIQYLNRWRDKSVGWSDELAFDQLYREDQAQSVTIHDIPKEYFMFVPSHVIKPKNTDNAVIVHRSSKSKSKQEQLKKRDIEIEKNKHILV